MNKNDLKILYMGTPEISAYVLESLVENGYHIVGVVAQPDRPVGRKQILTPVPTKIIAQKYNIPVYQPLKIRHDYSFINEIKPDVIVTLAYGQIVPEEMLNIPKYGAINLHGSLLPKYRGAAPIQYAIKNGDKITGMTLMKMVKAMDAGEMYMKKEVEIDEDDNSTTLFKKMGVAAKELILEALPLYIDGNLKGIEQDESLVSFCPTIKPEEEKIDLSLTSKEIVNMIRALSDEPGAYLYLDDLKFKIYKAKVFDDKIVKEIGEIVQADKNGLLMQCKDGTIALLEVQKSGKNRMNYKDFVNGNKDLVGKTLK